MKTKNFVLGFLFFISLSLVFAQTIPQEAISACEGKSAGEVCSFTGAQSESVSGTCLQTPDSQFACIPNSAAPDEIAQSSIQQTPSVEEPQKGFFVKLFDFFFGWMNSDKDENVNNDTKVMPGSDTDEHGCKPSAGYSWCEEKQKCLRVWEEDCVDLDEDSQTTLTSKVVDTNQKECFDEDSTINCPSSGKAFYGQDGNYGGIQPSYKDNGDGTITDLNTGLMWIRDAGDKTLYYDAKNSISYAGYSDWRIPTIKELYSLIDFSATNVGSTATLGGTPFIDDEMFVFEYGDITKGDRIIDSQWITSNIYVSKVMVNQECFFGVNFADGRIKCYPTANTGRDNGYFLRYVREKSYGTNSFVENSDGTVTDESSGLMWEKSDSIKGLDWESALSYCEDLNLGGYRDWRLPNAKELQYIVDYSRSPDTTDSPAIDPIFDSTSFTNLMGENDWGYYWTGTTHKSQKGGDEAVYIAFGRGLGAMNGQLMDFHGAGCQRSDPKSGNEKDYPVSASNAPQGDVQRVYNMVRCVRG